MNDKTQKDTDLREPCGAYKKSYPDSRPRLLPAVLLLALLCPVALLAGRYTPAEDALSRQIRLWMSGEETHGIPVAPVMEIEEIWAIEDARTESEDALAERMFNGDEILGYDRESRTFYCTIGAENGDAWPELALSVVGKEGISAAFIDDYTYDFCWDAVAEGFRYELLVYTDTEYAYAGVVFTGLPIVTIHTDDDAEIEWDTDIGADIHIADSETGALTSHALIHRRGGNAYVGVPKHSYRFEFRSVNLKGKDQRTERSVLGMEADSDWLLIGNASDYKAIRNHLCWQLWAAWKEGPQFGELKSRLVELFCGDEYMGIYQLMQYVNPEKELQRMGGNPKTDVLIRTIIEQNIGSRPVKRPSKPGLRLTELRYAPPGMTAQEAFAIFEPFEDVDILRTREMSDEEFAEILETHFDVQELIDYFLFIQLYGLRDNVRNNLYIWAIRQEDGTYRYSFQPWDMDRSLCHEESQQKPGELTSYDLGMVHRMLELDLMNSRQLMWSMFEEKRAGVLSDESIYAWLYAVEDEINATGAFLRESEKWRGGAQKLDVGELCEKMIELQNVFEENASWMWPLDENGDEQDDA